MSPTRPKRTPEEQQLLAATTRLRGRRFVEEHEQLILDQAYAIGDL